MATIDFHVKSSDQRSLWGTLSLPQGIPNPPVVMAHGSLGFKDWAFFPWLASFFADRGFPVVRFNFSGSGMGPQTDGPFTQPQAFEVDSISNQVEDLLTIINHLTRGELDPALPPQKGAVLWGHSRGGAVCLLAAGKAPCVKAVATWATVSRVNRYLHGVKQAWRKQGFFAQESSRTGQLLKYSTGFLDDVEKWGKAGDVPTYLHNLNLPVLLVHGSEDTNVPPEESESLAAVNRQARLAILSGANHKFNASYPFSTPPPVLVEAAEKTVHFYLSVRP